VSYYCIRPNQFSAVRDCLVYC